MDSNRRGFLLSLMAAPLVPPALALLADPKTFTPALDTVGRDVLAITVSMDVAFSEFYDDFMRVTIGDLVLYGPSVARDNAELRLLAFERKVAPRQILFKPAGDFDPGSLWEPGRVVAMSDEPRFISPSLGTLLPKPKVFRVAAGSRL